MNSQRSGGICPRLHSGLRAEGTWLGGAVDLSPPQPKPSVSPRDDYAVLCYPEVCPELQMAFLSIVTTFEVRWK